MEKVDINQFKTEKEKKNLPIFVGFSSDPRTPGVILEMYCFKETFEKQYPEIWKQINEAWNDDSIYKYGVRHADDDWDFPIALTGVNFMVNRYGILFTKKKLDASRENEIDLDEYFHALYKVTRESADIYNLWSYIDTAMDDAEHVNFEEVKESLDGDMRAIEEDICKA